MKSVPHDEFIRVIEFWVNQNWPMTKIEASEACRVLGWLESENGTFRTPYAFKVDRVFLCADLETGQVSRVDFRLSDVMIVDSVERNIVLNDLFAGYVALLKPEFGKPKLRKDKVYQRASWSGLHNSCRVDVSKGETSLSCYIYSPEYAEVERYLGERML